jgi:predicted outer membrane protein
MMASLAHGQIVGAPDAPTKGVGNYFSDRRFVTDALELGMADMARSRLASSNGSSKEVKEFADAVLKEANGTDAELRGVAAQEQIETPSKPDASQMAEIQRLESKKAAEFDLEYVEQSRKDLAKTIKTYQSETHSSDAALAAFAKKTLVALQERQSRAEKLDASKHP